MEIAHVGNSVANGASTLIFGEGFKDEKVKFYGWCPRDDTAMEKLSEIDKADMSLPATPPKEAGQLKIIAIMDNQAAAVLLNGGYAQHGGAREPFIVWAKGTNGYSQPYMINRPNLFFLENTVSAPGAHNRVIGRDMIAHEHGLWGGVFLKNTASGQVLKPLWGKYFDRQNHFTYQLDFEIIFETPPDAPEGKYEVWVHKGTGGWFGWCVQPLLMEVKKDAPANRPVFKVNDFGAVGDGLSDDTGAIQKAIEKARAAGGGIVLIPAGVYAIRSPLFLHPKVHLKGIRREMSSIRVVDQLGFGGEYLDQDWQGYARDFLPYIQKAKPLPMIYVCSESSVADLELIGGAKTAFNLYSFAGRDEFHDFTLTRCSLENTNASIYTSARGFEPDRGCFGGGNPWRQVRITHNIFKGGGVGTYSARNECIVSDNVTEPAAGGEWGTSGGFSTAGRHNIVENNVVKNANRGYGGAGIWAQKNNGENFVARNKFLDGGKHKGAGEGFLLEIGAGGHDSWIGRVYAAGADWFEASYNAGGQGLQKPPFSEPGAKPAFKPDEYKDLFVIICKGKGLGQYRVIKGNTEQRLSLESPWRVVPDSNSWVVVRRMYYNGIFMNNICRDSLGALEFWGGCLENVVKRHIAIRTAPLHAMTHGEPMVMYNRFEGCQLFDSSIGLWGLGSNNVLPGAATMIGNVFKGNELEGGSLLLVRSGSGGKAIQQQKEPSICWNLFAGNSIWPQRDQYAIHVIDKSCVGNVFYGNTYPMDRVLDNGNRTIWRESKDGMPYHFKDSYSYDVSAYKKKEAMIDPQAPYGFKTVTFAATTDGSCLTFKETAEPQDANFCLWLPDGLKKAKGLVVVSLHGS
ncbi:MAG: glycosyl hydrolase family 28-related protein, partial [Kiritimatiellota bacterium]|nr:glycosyl hydrolase family 28-related protein [Kiritimatiellota bacterium]